MSRSLSGKCPRQQLQLESGCSQASTQLAAPLIRSFVLFCMAGSSNSLAPRGAVQAQAWAHAVLRGLPVPCPRPLSLVPHPLSLVPRPLPPSPSPHLIVPSGPSQLSSLCHRLMTNYVTFVVGEILLLILTICSLAAIFPRVRGTFLLSLEVSGSEWHSL